MMIIDEILFMYMFHSHPHKLTNIFESDISKTVWFDIYWKNKIMYDIDEYEYNINEYNVE